MKYLSRALVFLVTCLLLIACTQAATATPQPNTALPSTSTSAPIPSEITAITSNPTPSNPLSIPLPTIAIPDGTNVPFPSSNPDRPTLLPTIDPDLLSDLLRQSITLQTRAGINGHTLRQITGWDYGVRQRAPCISYQWLDSNHLLFYPRTGEGMIPVLDSSVRGDLGSEPVVINLTSGDLWLRPASSIDIQSTDRPGQDCNSIYWSQELGILIDQENYASNYASKEGVATYTFDGQEVARYWGKILGVSPSGEKILVDEDTIIDLRSGKITDLAWYMNFDLEISSRLYWSSDETRLYRCCFYYADLKSGKSYNFEWSEMRELDGNPAPFSISPHPSGEWVRDDTYFFVEWDYWTYAGEPTVMFNPVEKKYYVIDMPSIRGDTATYTISPDGMYVWIKGYGEDGLYHGFLFDLMAVKVVSEDIAADEFYWSPDSQYAWMTRYDTSGEYILSVKDKKPLPFPVEPISDMVMWHPKDPVLAYLADNDRTLALLNTQDMSMQGWKVSTSVRSLRWSPTGDRLAFVSTDGSLWQVDYPNFGNFEQLTPALPNVSQANWSPDGNTIAFISGADIYIVDTTK